MSQAVQVEIAPDVLPADGLVAIPYLENKHLLPSDILARCYQRLVSENLLTVAFHERAFTELEFIQFAQECIFLIFANLIDNDILGVAWLTEIARTETQLRGFGGFVFYREFWKPRLTEQLGKIALDLWFKSYEMDSIWGITPAPNRLSRAYCTRVGFRYVAQIPGFTSYAGQTVDAMICRMTKEEFNGCQRRG